MGGIARPLVGDMVEHFSGRIGGQHLLSVSRYEGGHPTCEVFTKLILYVVLSAVWSAPLSALFENAAVNPFRTAVPFWGQTT